MSEIEIVNETFALALANARFLPNSICLKVRWFITSQIKKALKMNENS